MVVASSAKRCPVVFIAPHLKMGSARLRAVQISDELNRRGWISEIRPHCRAVEHAILIFIKGDNVDEVEAARGRGNTIIIDLIDSHQKTFHQLEPGKACRVNRLFPHQVDKELFDGLIFVNPAVQQRFSELGYQCRGEVLLHPWDNRFGVPQPHEYFSLVSLGHSGDMVSVENLDHVDLGSHVLTEKMITRVKTHSCHLSLRRQEQSTSMEQFGDAAWRYTSKSNIKVSTAAACGANIISSRDPGSNQVLPPEYPFWYDGAQSPQQFVERVRDQYGGSEWCNGLDMMQWVRQRTTTARIVDDYEIFLTDFV